MAGTRWAAAAFVVIMLAGRAFADIPSETVRAYNDAVAGGDAAEQVAAAEALADAVVAVPDAEGAGLLGFEAGSRLCLLAACATAREVASVVAEAAPVAGGPAQEERDLLLAFANWSDNDSRKTRSAFGKALKAAVATEPSLMSILAYEVNLQNAIADGGTRPLTAAAELAAAHMLPVRNAVPRQWATSEIIAATAQFSGRDKMEAVERLARAGAWVKDIRVEVDTPPAWLETLYWESEAWVEAMTGFMEAEGIEKMKLAQFQAARDEAAYNRAQSAQGSDAEEADRPFCEGMMVRPPEPKYPNRLADEGYMGAVIVGFSITEGEVTDAKILASVPGDLFDEASLEAMDDAEWRFDEEQQAADCKRSHDSMVYPFRYSLE